MGPATGGLLARAAFVGGVAAACAVAFLPLHAAVGSTAVLLAALPVALGGYLFGWRIGLTGGLLAHLLNSLLFAAAGSGPGAPLEGGLAPTLVLVFGGTGAGWMRDLQRRAQADTLVARKRALEAEALTDRVRSSERGLAVAQHIAHLGSWLWDIRTGRLTWSDELHHILGLETHAFVPTYEALVGCAHPNDRPGLREALERALRDHRPFEIEHRIVRPDGAVRWIHGRGEVIVDEAGNAIAMQGTGQDITERRRAEDARFELAAIVESSDDAIIATTVDGTITSWNAGAQRLYGYTAEEACGQPIWMLLPPEHRIRPSQSLARVLAGERVPPYETLRVPKSGGLIDVSVTLSPIRDDAGRVIGVSSISRDISERKRVDETLAHRAFHDQLTELPNRFLLQDRLAQLILSGRRDRRQLALLVMDLDRFKEINDTFGHAAGDVLLTQVGDRLRSGMRATDTVARLGGDEFALLLPSTDSQGAVVVAKELLRSLERPFLVEGHAVEVGASLGIVVYPEHGDDAGVLLRRADVAMYVAKRSGGGLALYSADADDYTPGRLALVNELRQALEHGGLAVHYQPELDLRTGRATRVEALTRWHHPQRGLILPSEFIPVAERSGLMALLTRWVLDAAIRQCRAWDDAGIELGVAVNLSVKNLLDAALPDAIADLLVEWRVRPERVWLEITESTLMADPERARATLARLHALGVRIALDDFGTGYSSLAYLNRLPIDQVKIDRSFVIGMAFDEGSAAIVRATVDLGHSLGFEVVAEGVEDERTLRRLQALGCDTAQGYHIARPMPARELELRVERMLAPIAMARELAREATAAAD